MIVFDGAAYLPGCQVRSLMHRRGITIRVLAYLLDVTMKRVREVRAHGVTGDLDVTGWVWGLQAAQDVAPIVERYKITTKQAARLVAAREAEAQRLSMTDPFWELCFEERWLKERGLTEAANIATEQIAQYGSVSG